MTGLGRPLRQLRREGGNVGVNISATISLTMMPDDENKNNDKIMRKTTTTTRAMAR